MKSIFSFLFFIVFSLSIQAQLKNISFESWYNGVNNLATPIGAINVNFRDPVGWTTLNQASNLNLSFPVTINGIQAARQDTSNKYDSTSSIRLRTEELVLPIVGNQLIPGVAINGLFKIDVATLQLGVMRIPGTGTPISSRPKGVYGYYKFHPAGGDTSDMIAILKKGTEIIAMARFSPKDSVNTWTRFDLNFKYESCTMPDTIVIGFSTQLLENAGGPNGTVGTTLWIDSVGIDSLVGFNPPLPPHAINDSVEINCLSTTDVFFKANDFTCNLPVKYTYGGQLNANAGIPILMGNGASQKLQYTPLVSNFKNDYIAYTICDTVSGLCDTGLIVIKLNPIVNKMKNDIDTALQNTLKNILVKKNDTLSNCFNTNTLSISNGPKNGTAAVSANTSINYTPKTGFSGKDTFSYKFCAILTGNTICDSAMVYVTVKSVPTNSGLSKTEASIAFYPNPSNDYIHFMNVANFESIEVFNMIGQSLRKMNIQHNFERISVMDYLEGNYFFTIKDKQGNIVLKEQIKIVH